MIGNDIVDLEQAAKDSNWMRKGYLDKLFTEGEQFLIKTAEDANLMVWLLWSMKESAYKINSRQTKLRSFAPVKLVCNDLILHNQTAKGLVEYDDELYYTSSEFNQDYIHTIASDKKEELEQIRISITGLQTDYQRSKPKCVSHHGRYLALTYL